MPLAEFRYASGHKVHAGDKGRVYPPKGYVGGGGVIYVLRAAIHGPDANLWGALKVASDDLNVTLQVNSFDTGTHSPNSRHYAGLAADINKMGDKRSTWQQVTMNNRFAVEFVDLFLAAGWRIGEGDPTRAGILLGPPHSRWNPTGIDHTTHLHLSIARFRPGEMPPGFEGERLDTHC